MAEVRPFRALRYNSAKVGDLSPILCPPYDIIDRELDESLRNRSPYNAVFLEGAERPDWHASASERYAQAASLFKDWQSEEVLRRDTQPSYYLMEHSYSFQGNDLTRLGLICCVGLAEYAHRQVLPHEYTQEPAVLDRVALMEACNANFSPIMSIYRDATGALATLFRQVVAEEQPVFRVQDDSGQKTALWQITKEDVQGRISAIFEDIPVFLADGHHRYEAALRLKGQRQKGNEADDTQAHGFVMIANRKGGAPSEEAQAAFIEAMDGGVSIEEADAVLELVAKIEADEDVQRVFHNLA